MKKLSHAAYREYIASHLLTTSLPHATCTQRMQQADPELEYSRLNGKYFPIKVGSSKNQMKRKNPTKCCKICNFTQQQRHCYMYIGPSLPTTFTCNKCWDIPMCHILFWNLSYRNSLQKMCFAILYLLWHAGICKMTGCIKNNQCYISKIVQVLLSLLNLQVIFYVYVIFSVSVTMHLGH